MHKIILISILFFPLSHFAQSTSKTDAAAVGTAKLGIGLEQSNNKLAGSTANNSLMAFDERYEGIKNSHFLLPYICDAEVFWGNSNSKKLRVRYDAVNRELISYASNKDSSAIFPGSFLIFDKPNNRVLSFVTPAKLDAANSDLPLNYMQILHRNSLVLLKNVGKKFEPANYKGAFSDNRTYDSFVENSEYYILNKNKNVFKISLRGSKINKALKKNGYQSNLKGLISEENLVAYLQLIDK